ncbi:MAG: hypothetical protein ACYTEQ_09325 [Planctomycetota bacterium]|jgi:hypothetical protein
MADGDLNLKDIDPRWLTTPTGAAIGLLIAHRMMQKGKRRPEGYIAGGGIGGGLGYMLGNYIKGAQDVAEIHEEAVKDATAVDQSKALSPIRQLSTLPQLYEENNGAALAYPATDQEMDILRRNKLTMPRMYGEQKPSTIKVFERQEPHIARAMAYKVRLVHLDKLMERARKTGDVSTISEARKWVDRNQKWYSQAMGDAVGKQGLWDFPSFAVSHLGRAIASGKGIQAQPVSETGRPLMHTPETAIGRWLTAPLSRNAAEAYRLEMSKPSFTGALKSIFTLKGIGTLTDILPGGDPIFGKEPDLSLPSEERKREFSAGDIMF